MIDLFAGPGGLGEGFSKLHGGKAFNVRLSIECDSHAFRTLLLRKLQRATSIAAVEAALVRNMKSWPDPSALEDIFSSEFKLASRAAWQARLGSVDSGEVLEKIRSALGPGVSDWVLIGGPPCQAYSLAGRARNKGVAGYRAEEDERHYLYQSYLEILSELQPSVFVMENVKGVLSSSVGGARIFEQILCDLEQPGGRRRGAKYDLYPMANYELSEGAQNGASYVVHSERHGLPQARHRVFIIGVRRDIGLRMKPLPVLPAQNIEGVLARLPRLRSGISARSGKDSFKGWQKVLRATASPAFLRRNGIRGELATMLKKAAIEAMDIETRGAMAKRRSRRGSDGEAYLWNHETRSHRVDDIQRYVFAACFAELNGKSPKIGDFPGPDLFPNHVNARESAETGALFADRFKVQVKGRPSSTITSHIHKDGHYFIHYDAAQARSLTVREAARIQTFPDSYIFCGPRTEQYKQVGNAVPPMLAEMIAAEIWGALQE